MTSEARKYAINYKCRFILNLRIYQLVILHKKIHVFLSLTNTSRRDDKIHCPRQMTIEISSTLIIEGIIYRRKDIHRRGVHSARLLAHAVNCTVCFEMPDEKTYVNCEGREGNRRRTYGLGGYAREHAACRRRGLF